jgi:hypothetical protein
MAGSGKGQNTGRSGGRKGDGARADRLRAALRENLKRRKAQAKGRSLAHDSAEIVTDKSRD